MKRISGLILALISAVFLAGCSPNGSFNDSDLKRWQGDLEKIGELEPQGISSVVMRWDGTLNVYTGDGSGTIGYVAVKNKHIEKTDFREVKEAIYKPAHEWPLGDQVSAFDLHQICQNDATGAYVDGDALYTGEVLFSAWCLIDGKGPFAVGQKIGDVELPKPDSAEDLQSLEQIMQTMESFIDPTQVREIEFGSLVGKTMVDISTEQGVRTDGSACHRRVAYGKIWGATEPSWSVVCYGPDSNPYFEIFDITQIDLTRVANGLAKLSRPHDSSVTFGVHHGQYVLVLNTMQGSKAYGLDELGV